MDEQQWDLIKIELANTNRKLKEISHRLEINNDYTKNLNSNIFDIAVIIKNLDSNIVAIAFGIRQIIGFLAIIVLGLAILGWLK